MKSALALTIALLSASAHAECLKQVFNTYCLGGNFTEVEAKPSDTFSHGPATVYSYRGADHDLVSVYQGKIESVTRMISPANALTYKTTRAELVALYGEPKTVRQLPDYARTESSIETAITLRKGRISDRWQFDGWMIILFWNDGKAISLTYSDNALRAARRAENPNPKGY